MRIRNFLVLLNGIAIASASADRESLPPSIRDAEDAAPLRLMFVGDSITHGHEADFTWRYRFWQWIKETETPFTFAGPYTGTCAPSPVLPPQPPDLREIPMKGPDGVDDFPRIDWGYARDASKDFDAHHFATSGDRADRVKKLIQSRVEEYTPNMLLILLGFNDLSWGGATPDSLIESLKTLIDNARAANPTIRLAVGNVVHEAYSDADLEDRTVKFNELLKSTYTSWRLPESPVYHVDVAGVYTCGPNRECTSTADGLHPNELGAYQIAHAFSKSMIKDFSIGSQPVSIPKTWTERPVDPPTNVKAASTSMGIKATWDRPWGITDFHVRRRSGDGEWIMDYGVKANRTDTILPEAGIQFEYQIRSCMGRRCGEWSSDYASAVSDRKTGPPPETVRTSATALGFHVSWEPPKEASKWNITQYDVSFYNMNTKKELHVGTLSTSATLEGMASGEMSVVGAVLDISISAWMGPGNGTLFTRGRPVLPGALLTPQKPLDVHSEVLNKTAVHLTWTANEYTAGYLVYIDGHTDGNATLDTEKVVVVATDFLPEICISAVNGESESEKSCLPGIPKPESIWKPKGFTAYLAPILTLLVLATLVTSVVGMLRCFKSSSAAYKRVSLA